MKSLLKTLLYTFAFLALSQDHLRAEKPFVQGFSQVEIILSKDAGSVDTLVAALLKERILEKSSIRISISKESDALPKDGLLIFLGRPEHHASLQEHLTKNRIPNLSGLAPGPEGFLIQQVAENHILAAGIDDRGCLYAVGELLR